MVGYGTIVGVPFFVVGRWVGEVLVGDFFEFDHCGEAREIRGWRVRCLIVVVGD